MKSFSFEIDPWLRCRPSRVVQDSLARRLRRAVGRMGFDPVRAVGIGLRIVNDATIAELNHQFMGQSGPTDVLSFPAEDLDEDSAGDLVLCWDAVQRQAQGASDTCLLDESTVLCVHALAHLLGHDHRQRSEARRMHALEKRVLRSLGVADIPRPYAHGSTSRSVVLLSP